MKPKPLNPTRPCFRLAAGAVFACGFSLVVLGTPDVQDYLRNTDHGMQLALGEQIRQGRVPGVDVYFQYGPGAGYASALALMLSGSLLGETVLCAAGYATVLTLLFCIVRRVSSLSAALLAVATAWLLLARLYKWYVWLAPLLLLSLWSRHEIRRTSLSAAALGLAVGGVSLFRWDYGVTGFATLLLAELLFPTSTRRRERGRFALLMLAGYALPNLLWLGALGALHGPDAAVRSVQLLIGGSARLASELSVPPPLPSLDLPLSQPARLAPAFWSMPVLYLAGMALALIGDRRRHGDHRSRLVGVAALLGASVFHQALYRPDPQHVLQALPMALVLVPVLSSLLWRGALIESNGLLAPRAAAAALLLLGIGFGSLLRPYGRTDLEPPFTKPLARLRSLHGALVADIPGAYGRLLTELRRQTDAGDPVLFYPISPQLYSFARRPLAGRLLAYYPGSFDVGRWREDNLHALAQDPPVRIVVPANLFSSAASTPDALRQQARRAHPAVDDLIRTRYTRQTYRNRLFVILSLPDATPHENAALLLGKRHGDQHSERRKSPAHR